jgi:hypothetical protein
MFQMMGVFAALEGSGGSEQRPDSEGRMRPGRPLLQSTAAADLTLRAA